jgi:hypothetical protein
MNSDVCSPLVAIIAPASRTRAAMREASGSGSWPSQSRQLGPWNSIVQCRPRPSMRAMPGWASATDASRGRAARRGRAPGARGRRGPKPGCGPRRGALDRVGAVAAVGLPAGLLDPLNSSREITGRRQGPLHQRLPPLPDRPLHPHRRVSVSGPGRGGRAAERGGGDGAERVLPRDRPDRRRAAAELSPRSAVQRQGPGSTTDRRADADRGRPPERAGARTHQHRRHLDAGGAAASLQARRNRRGDPGRGPRAGGEDRRAARLPGPSPSRRGPARHRYRRLLLAARAARGRRRGPARLPVSLLRRQGQLRAPDHRRAKLRPQRRRGRPLRAVRRPDRRHAARRWRRARHTLAVSLRRGLPADVAARLR